MFRGFGSASGVASYGAFGHSVAFTLGWQIFPIGLGRCRFARDEPFVDDKMNGETRARLIEVISWLKNKTLPDAGRMETRRSVSPGLRIRPIPCQLGLSCKSNSGRNKVPDYAHNADLQLGGFCPTGDGMISGDWRGPGISYTRCEEQEHTVPSSTRFVHHCGQMTNIGGTLIGMR